MDSKNRVAVLVRAGDKFLIGHAPNKKMAPNTWDLPKGHIEVGEDPIVAAQRELYEETGIVIDATSDLYYLGTTPYNGGKISFFEVILPHIVEDLKCTTYFELWGRTLPEISKYDWITLDEFERYLYKSLQTPIKKIQNLIK